MVNLPSHAQIVIIGGGITGCSIAYHLTQSGCEDVVLLDKGELTSGSTWHAAGLVTQFHTSPVIMAMRIYSVKLYKALRESSGAEGAWHEVGSIRVAASEDHFKSLQRQVSTAKALGMDVDIIGPEEALRIYPHMTGKDLYGALYIPGDGHLDPSTATFELARQARARGAQIYTGERVTGIGLRGHNVTSVQTEHGVIKCETVVNAGGMWAPQVGAMVGVKLPMVPLLHQHLTTRPIPGHELPRETPVLRDPVNLCYIREEVGGFLIGGFELEPKPWSVHGVPWDFTQKLLPGDWELFEPIMEGAIRRVPILERAELMRLVNGPEAITPDSRPLLGPVPGLRGYFVACGLSHTGFGAGGDIGRIIAEWIIEGEPSTDTAELNVRRFGKIYEDTDTLTARASESYRYYYFLRFPHDENESARELRISPVEERLKALGAVFGEKNGWERVNYFSRANGWRRAGPEQRKWGWGRAPYFEQVGDEHRAVRERVALLDMTSFGKIDVQGPGALALLQYLTDNDVDRPVGSLIYAQFLNSRGGIESDLTVARLGEEHFRVISGSAFVAADLGWLQMHMPRDGSVTVTEVTDDYVCLGLFGPRARDVLQAVTGDDVSNEVFPYMSARFIKLDGIDVLAQRVSYVGELGWELYIPSASNPQSPVSVWDRLVEAGRPYDIGFAGYKAIDSLRLEKGYRYWSADITPSENPYEAGLGFCVRLEKGDFSGREALRGIKAEGIKQRLCTITLDDPGIVIYGGEAVFHEGAVLKRVRSGGWGYTVGKSICLSYLPLALAAPGTALEVEVFGQRVPAQVAEDVLYDPEGQRLKA